MKIDSGLVSGQFLLRKATTALADESGALVLFRREVRIPRADKAAQIGA